MQVNTGGVITLVSILLISGLVGSGCTPSSGYTSMPLESAVMQPTFCLYRDPEFRHLSPIGSITVEKKRIVSAEAKKRWELNWPWKPEDFQTVWHLEYKAADNLIWGTPSPIPCLTYGEVPPGYQAALKALPLEPEQFYTVSITGHQGMSATTLKFIIRLDANGTPERLEYHKDIFLITHPDYPTQPRDQLKLYHSPVKPPTL